MNQYKLTVIIPTRERADTLRHCLRTVTSQPYQNLEIIVSDNFSQDATKEVVYRCNDGRVKYVNTGKRLGMSDNWEFAFSQVTGDYVIYLGDDDGLLPGAITKINFLLNSSGTDILSWDPATYHWDSSPNIDFRSSLYLPLNSGCIERDSYSLLKSVLEFSQPYYRLPIPYIRSVVSVGIMKDLVRKSGRLINSRTPDVYLGVAIANEGHKFSYSKSPLSVAGISGHSNGAAQLNLGVDKRSAKLVDQEDNIPFHKDVEYIPVIPFVLWEAVLQVRDHLGIHQSVLSHLDAKKAIKYSIPVCKSLALSDEGAMLEKVALQARRVGLSREFTSWCGDLAHARPLSFCGYGLNIKHNILSLPCDRLYENNIYGASQLCSNILSMLESGLFSLDYRKTLVYNARLAKNAIYNLLKR